MSFIDKYDIIGVQESKLDDVDKIQVPGYQVFSNNRKALSRYRSGGITLLVKLEWLPFITVHKFDNKLILWFTISKRITANHEDLHCGVVYIPPYHSKYAHTDPYLELQNEINKYMLNSQNIMLFGDFNSRSSSIDDFVICDDFICDIQGNDELFKENQDILNHFDLYDIPLLRTTSDHTTNFYGQQMIDFCKYNNIFILNGRLDKDIETPKLTCKDRSTVDYFISTVQNFPFIKNFDILDFNILYSDAHCPVTLSLDILPHKSNTSSQNQQSDPKIKLWDENKSHQFVENIRQSDVDAILQSINEISSENANAEIVNSIVGKIETLFLSNSKNTFGVKKPPTFSKNKTWFNTECKNARNIYHNARKMYNKAKTQFYKNRLKIVSKEYKNIISKSVKNFKKSRVEKLRNLRHTNAKEYWKIINSAEQKDVRSPPLNDLYTYFKNLNSNDTSHSSEKPTSHEENPPEGIQEINQEINQPISESEIICAIQKLKNNKSAGSDSILNEHIKCTLSLFLPIYLKLFNIIFDSGIVPESWAVGDILPIYKNKGNVTSPENYRPITLLSCLGKVFTSIINSRLYTFAEKYEIICPNQAGFRKGLSTIDNLFVLQTLIEISKTYKNKLFCAFIDFKQAFDNVWRGGLWTKLRDYNVNGKCLNLIKNMYENIKSRVSTADGSSAFFPCCKGVRQGENLSPILFSLYLNDLDRYFMINNVGGITAEVNAEHIYSYLKIFILLFADDTVLFSHSKDELQGMLNLFENYCDEWKLTVNISKTKVLIFTSGRYAKNYHFFFKDKELELVTEYKYLGIYLSKSGSYVSCKKHIADQANNAMYSLLRKIRVLNLPIEMQIDLFNKLIKPILLYGCEIWAVGNIDVIERVQLKFLKMILNLKKSTPSYMVYGETGTFPLRVDTEPRIISYWTKLIDFNTNRLSNMMYNILYTLYELRRCKSKWLTTIKTLITKNGFGNIWMNPNDFPRKWFQSSFKQKIKDQYIQEWNSLVSISSSGVNYKIFKNQFGLNNYFLKLNNKQCRILTAFRTRNHKLPVETGRWNNTPLSERICHFCQTEVGDELHFVLKCNFFNDQRTRYIKPYYRNRPNVCKMSELLNHPDQTVLQNLTSFVEIIMKSV